jgi:hypothetical protein
MMTSASMHDWQETTGGKGGINDGADPTLRSLDGVISHCSMPIRRTGTARLKTVWPAASPRQAIDIAPGAAEH